MSGQSEKENLTERQKTLGVVLTGTVLRDKKGDGYIHMRSYNAGVPSAYLRFSFSGNVLVVLVYKGCSRKVKNAPRGENFVLEVLWRQE